MENKPYFKCEDIKLRNKYDEGLLSSEDFLLHLFKPGKADRLKRAILDEMESLTNKEQKEEFILV